MADVSYESLESQIGEQKTQISSQREIIKQQRTTGERGIQSLRRVHPRTPPSVYFGQVDPQIKTIKSQLVGLTTSEKELDVAEKQLVEQEQLIAERKAEGWKVRETPGGQIEFYKPAPTSPYGRVAVSYTHLTLPTTPYV